VNIIPDFAAIWWRHMAQQWKLQ